MSDAGRCPHCKTELPEAATFCAACGRRVEGWKVDQNTTPALGETALPGGDDATRQMQPTPSLLRAAAISVKKGGVADKKGAATKRAATKRAATKVGDTKGSDPKGSDPKGSGRRPHRSRLPLMMAMLLVAAAGGAGGFLIVRGRVRRAPPQPKPPAVTALPSVTAPAAPVVVAPSGAPATPPAPKVTMRKNNAGKKAHVISSVPVAVKADKKPKKVAASSSAGLPHKSVTTDSKALTMPTAQRETTGESGAPTPAAANDSDDKEVAEARIDADSVRLVVRLHLPQVRSCYARAFKDGSPGGAVELGFAIDGQGHAKNVRTETNTTDSEPLARCLEARVKEWQFPRPVGGDYELIYPFVFAPGS